MGGGCSALGEKNEKKIFPVGLDSVAARAPRENFRFGAIFAAWASSQHKPGQIVQLPFSPWLRSAIFYMVNTGLKFCSASTSLPSHRTATGMPRRITAVSLFPGSNLNRAAGLR
jgi:hypothetical protein